ncbi:MAG: FAD-dependent oxidoreductase [Acinetobacter pittii]|nr:FAD-dependent oxidoreductase [Acinetobacter pittii]
MPTKGPLNIIVVGAGLGGLATAIALASSGHTVTVYEQAQKLGEVLAILYRC